MTSARPLLAAAVISAGGFLLVMLVALHTSRGLQIDRDSLARLSGAPPVPAQVAGVRALRTIDGASVTIATLILVFAGLVRRRVARALGAGAIVALSVGSAELLKHVLVPRLLTLPAGRPPTFPSGHTAVAASVGLGLVLALPPVLRPLAALVGAAYAAGIAFSLVVLSWHFPSDVVGSLFLCAFWAALVGAAVHATPRRSVTPRGVAIAAVATALGLVVAAAIATRHPEAGALVRSRTAMFAAAACLGALSLAIFGAISLLVGEVRPEPHRRPQ